MPEESRHADNCLKTSLEVKIMKHSYRMRRIVAIAALGASFVFFSPVVLSASMPYCTVASNQGSQWWTWTVSPQSKACKVAEEKLGNNFNWKWRSYYSDNSLNQGKLVCRKAEGKYQNPPKIKTVRGNGSDVFPNALNMASQLGWSACYFKMS